MVVRLVATKYGAAPSRDDLVHATPFLKWAGGKTQLLKTFSRYFPRRFNRYFEPFLGGGAVFFHLASRHGEFSATISDCNAELINTYTMVKKDPQTLLTILKKHRNDKHYFYKMRSLDPGTLCKVERAARLIYLNKTCFNGLYRVNRKGQFNVPFGRYKNPAIADEGNIRAASQVLRKAEIVCGSYEKILASARAGDFVYLDPPYQPLSATANFTGYTKGSFSADDQRQLAEVSRQLSRKGCLVMQSNSDTEFVRDLYKGFRIEPVFAIRAINSNAQKRGRITELVIMNYDPPEDKNTAK